MKPASLYALLRDAALAFSQDNAPRLAAALSYYALSSIAPLLVLVVAVASRFLANVDVQAELLSGIRSSVGNDVANFIGTLLAGSAAQREARSGVLAGVIGVVTVFLTATGLFVQLQQSLNSLWGADPPPAQGLWALIRTRLVAFALVLVFGALILAFLAGNTYLSVVAEQLGGSIGLGAFFVRVGTFVLSTLIFTPIFAFLYKFLPDVRLEWREVWTGAFVTALLFTGGQALIGVYFAKAAPSSVYGAAGALFLLLLWIYYSAMIVFFGAEVTWVYSQRFGTRAGGAGNMEKKNAVAGRGAEIDTSLSASEAETIAQTPDQPGLPSHARRLIQRLSFGRLGGAEHGSAHPSRPLTPNPVPSLRSALSNAALALLAVPAVAVLRLLQAVGLLRR